MERNTSRSNGRRLNRALFGVAALVLMAVVALSYREWQQFKRVNVDAAQTREVVDSIDQLLSSVTDAETGQRGFLLTGEDRYLHPYNQALQVIPNQLGTVRRLLAGHSNESGNLARLNNLVDEKLAELRQTIDIRRTEGMAPANTVVLSDRGQQTMEETRALVAQIRRTELSSRAQGSTEGEAAAQTALLAAVAGSLVLLFLFAVGLGPFIEADSLSEGRSWILRYGAAVLATTAAVALRMALIPLIGPTELAFSIFLVAVIFSAWFGGFRPGGLCILLCALAGDYYFTEPFGSFLVRKPSDQISLVIFIVVGFGVALLSDSQGRALARARRAENAERDERQRFETTLTSIGDAVIATDAKGHIVFTNKVAQSLMRVAGPETAGKHLDGVFRIVNEVSRAKVESPVTKVLREGGIVGIANHTVLIASDGTEIPIDDSGAPIRNVRGELIGVVLVFRDITERRMTERLLAEQTAELRQKTRLMERAPSFVRDLEDRIVYWNQGAADLYGFSAAEAEGHVSHSLLKTVFPSALDEILEQLMREGQWDGDLMHTCRDGRRVIVASHWALHRDAEARVVSILEVNVDITERKAAEEALRVSNAALLRANEDLNQFAFAASHDLQEPLRMITSYSQLLLKGYRGQLDGEASTCIEFITEGNKRMRALLADLLAYTQAAGDVQQAIRPVDLNRVFQTALRNCQTAMDEARAVITSDNLPAIPGYEPHFVQLFQNLISNGLKYRGERPPRIHVSAKLQDGLWRIAIQDNGIGIAPEYHKQIFGVFKRLHGRTIPGTGIGLAICQRVVERYGGQIWVESQVNEGATFYLTLPTAAKGAAAHEG